MAQPPKIEQLPPRRLPNAELRTLAKRALQAYPGHKDIQHTVRYTDLAPDRFKDFWR